MGRYLKEILILNSFSFEDKDPRFTRLKPDLALRLLFYVRAMQSVIIFFIYGPACGTDNIFSLIKIYKTYFWVETKINWFLALEISSKPGVHS